MTAIFLDVDGVLNNHQPWPNGHNPILHECVEHLNTVLAEVSNAYIVLSSNWRWTFRDVPAVQALLCCHGCNCWGRVHGVTCSDLDVCEGPMPEDRASLDKFGPIWRAAQIQRYICEHEIDRYVVLDDLSIPISNLVQTNPAHGLLGEDAIRAVSILLG